MAISKSDLDEYLVTVRRIAEHRESAAEKEMLKAFRECVNEIRSFLGGEYAKYAEDDALTMAVLQREGEYARFVEEVLQKYDDATLQCYDTVNALVNDTYKQCYQGMVDGVNKCKRVEELHEEFTVIKAITPEIVKRAVQNPIPKLRLPQTMERCRKKVISGIKREIAVGLAMGDRMSTMAKRITDKVQTGYKQSVLIARTEVHRVREGGFNDAASRIDEKFKAANAPYRMVKTWHNSKDGRVRHSNLANHVAMEGQTVLQDEKFTLVQSGAKATAPGQSGVACEDCNCRCYVTTEIMDDAEFFAVTGRHFDDIVKRKERTSKGIQKQSEDDKSNFVPAKTVEEAQEYAKQFCEPSMMERTFKGEVNYKGISLDSANAINKSLTEVYGNLQLEKLSGIKVVSPTSAQGKKAFKDSTDAVFAYSPIEHGIFVNKDVLKSAKTFETYTVRSKEAWNTVMNNIDKLTGAQKELALTYQKAGRSLVDGKTVKGLFTHELGHHVQWTLLDTATNNAVGKRMSWYAPRISGYANASKSEYLAESFSSYMNGEKNLIDPEYVQYLDSKLFDKYVKSDIIESRNRVGSPVKPIEKTLDMVLNPEMYSYKVAKKYKINLKAGGKPVEIIIDDSIVQYGKTLKSEPYKIRIGRMAFENEEELANTIAHELNHSRSFVRGGDAPESTAYAAGNALAEFIRGER